MEYLEESDDEEEQREWFARVKRVRHSKPKAYKCPDEPASPPNSSYTSSEDSDDTLW